MEKNEKVIFSKTYKLDTDKKIDEACQHRSLYLSNRGLHAVVSSVPHGYFMVIKGG